MGESQEITQNLKVQTVLIEATKEKVGHKNAFLAAILAWAVPGLGYAYMGKWAKACILFVTVIGLAAIGGSMLEFKGVSSHYGLNYIAQLGLGLPTIILGLLNNLILDVGLAEDFKKNMQFDISTLYLNIAGLLNYIVVVYTLLLADMNVYRVNTPVQVEPEQTSNQAHETVTVSSGATVKIDSIGEQTRLRLSTEFDKNNETTGSIELDLDSET